jgi:hypothetical protein
MLSSMALSHLGRFSSVSDTDEGARLETHCRYPSFDPVYAFIVKVGEEYHVHDGAGASRCGWDHGRDRLTIKRALDRQAAIFELSVANHALVSRLVSEEWMVSCVLAVANASAAAAMDAVSSIHRSDSTLRTRIYRSLRGVIEEDRIAREWKIHGRSGKQHAFDFGVRIHDDKWILIDSVSPHHVSIASKYVAFADTGGDSEQIAARFAVFDEPLETDDATLIRQVADLVPFSSLNAGVRREMVVQ